MTRLFIAIDLPDSIKDSIAELCTGLREAKWVDLRQLHLTLRFIGEADDRVFNAIKESLAEISETSFSLTLRGVGCFPPKRDPRVLWVGIEHNDTLLRLVDKVERVLVERNHIPPEQRSFTAHITIARFRDRPRAGVDDYLRRNESFRTETFPVDAFHLYSSTLTREGAVHRKECSYHLR